jgi:hypothetical protein
MAARKRQRRERISIRLAWGISAAILLLLATSAHCSERFCLALKTTAAVSGENVRLGDVAQLNDDNANEAILKTVVGRSPNPGPRW